MNRLEPAPTESGLVELHLRPDGTIYARNLTPTIAGLLLTLNPDDPSMRLRAGLHLAGTDVPPVPPVPDEPVPSPSALPSAPLVP